MEFSTYTLPNGIRGIHRQVRNTVAHCALVIGAGSRDEHPAESLIIAIESPPLTLAAA